MSSCLGSRAPIPRPVLGGDLGTGLHEMLLRGSLQHLDACVLLCGRSWQPMQRILIVNQPGPAADSQYLETAIELCREIQRLPVVLTVGRSVRQAE